ncbi:MAG: SGNH/GDSL hydrolase family protein [Acidobacteria bacterium]|nr:SGNH/GDSL hydrolase family protein [Acidobacteriota bacterium]
MRSSVSILFLVCAGSLISAPGQLNPRRSESVQVSPDTRIAQLIQANVIATHAYQALLVKKTARGSTDCYGSGRLLESDLVKIVEHQKRLLAHDRAAIVEWTQGRKSNFRPSIDLEPILTSPLNVPEDAPVNVVTAWLSRRSQAHRNDVRATASLLQTVLETDRDGDLLQEQFDFYIGLRVRVFLGHLGLDGSDASFLAAGEELSPMTCASPFDTGPEAWQLAMRKIWNWAEKKLHIRDEWAIARELLREPGVAELLPAVQAMPAQRIAVIGHSFTMGAHWSSPSSFVPIVSAMFALQNPRVEFRQFYSGGLTASRALREFYEFALEWKPDKVLLVVMTRRDEDYAALEAMGKGFRDAGAMCYVFDNVHDPEMKDPAVVRRFAESARSGGMTVIEVDGIISGSPDRDRFLCLDKIHMTEPYHRLMANEWFRFLAGARSAALDR